MLFGNRIMLTFLVLSTRILFVFIIVDSVVDVTLPNAVLVAFTDHLD